MSGKKVDEWLEDIRIARQLGYPSEVIKKLKAESNSNARQRILHDARKGKYGPQREWEEK